MNTKEIFKREWIFWLCILLPLGFILIRWNDFPDKIPMHWDISGEVDRYSGKWSVFMGPGIALAVYFLMLFIPRLDPRKKNYALFEGSYFTIRLGLVLFLALMSMVVLLASLHYQFNVSKIIIASVLGLFLLLGNLFGRIRPNYFVGLRTPWTLNNEEVWRKTHRFAGKLWVIATIPVLVVLWWLPLNVFIYVFIAYLLLIVGVPIFYSWKIYKTVEKGNGEIK